MQKEIKIKKIININWTFRKKIFLFFTVINIAAFLLIFLLIIKHEKEILINDLIKRGKTVVKTFALSCENTLVLNNELEMEDIVDVTVKEKDVVNAYIVLPDSTYYLHNNRKFLGRKYIYPKTLKIDLAGSYIVFERDNKIFYQFSHAIYKQNENYEKKIFGFAYIELTTKFINKSINTTIKKLFLIFLIVFIISILLSIYLSLILVKPIKKLVKAIKIIGEGKLRYKIKLRTNDELNLLISEFNSMTKKLYSAQKKLIQQEKS
jgi:methyl-accepting chemotaxis protein